MTKQESFEYIQALDASTDLTWRFLGERSFGAAYRVEAFTPVITARGRHDVSQTYVMQEARERRRRQAIKRLARESLNRLGLGPVKLFLNNSAHIHKIQATAL